MAVTMYPGLMVFTRMPCWPHSLARFLASCITPAFEALYAGSFISHTELCALTAYGSVAHLDK